MCPLSRISITLWLSPHPNWAQGRRTADLARLVLALSVMGYRGILPHDEAEDDTLRFVTL